MSSSSGYGSVPSEPLPEHERPDWMRSASTPPSSPAGTSSAPFGYSVDAPSPYAAQPPAGQPYAVQPNPQQPYVAPQSPGSQDGHAVPVPPPGYPGTSYQQAHPYQQGSAQQHGYPYPQGYPQPGAPWAPDDAHAKSRVVAGLLGIFLGALGIHRFYTGHTGIGILMLLLTVMSFGILAFATSIWGLVEGILYLTDRTGSYSRDARGRPLRG